MSTNDGELSDTCCASCGTPAIDDIKLKSCDGGCDLVKYCSDKCQTNHREQHEEECLRDKKIFTRPDGSHMGECPICCLPLSTDPRNSFFTDCCSKLLCDGCNNADAKSEFLAGRWQLRCAFCREPAADTEEEADKRLMERVKKNDPAAMCFMAKTRREKGDCQGAVEYFTKAAELGDAEAHFVLSLMYFEGEGVEKDKEKEIYHLEEASIGGHPTARNLLGSEEANNGRYERARKHWIIAANLGYNASLKALRQLYADGHASKEDYANALRAYQTVVNEAKNAEREEAEAYYKSVATSREE